MLKSGVSRAGRAVLAFCALAGAVAGYTGARGRALEATSGAPPGWGREVHNAAYMSDATLGELAPAPGAWSLSAYGALVAGASSAAAPGPMAEAPAGGMAPGGRPPPVPRAPPSPVAVAAPSAAHSASLQAELGVDGELWVVPASSAIEAPTGRALALRTGQAPRVETLRPGERARVAVCTGSLPIPGPEAYAVVWSRTATGDRFASGGQAIECPGGEETGWFSLVSGLHRVRIASITLDERAVPAPQAAWISGAAAAVGALLAAGLAVAELTAGVAPWAVALAALPLCFAPWIQAANLGGLREALRIVDLRVQRFPLLLGLVGSGTIRAATYGIRLSTSGSSGRSTWVLVVCLVALAAASVVATGGWAWGPASTLAAGAGSILAAALLRLASRERLPWAGIAASSAGMAAVAGWSAWSVDARGLAALWCVLVGVGAGCLVQLTVHAPKLRAYNLASLAVAAFVGVGLEMAVRSTSAGQMWDAGSAVHSAGDITTLAAQLDTLAASKHEKYPSAGFPVEAPPKTHAVRVVCMGGSSTAGAYQNSDIREFYPALLPSYLPSDVEVVNQGTGGWNTLHMALFASTNFASLQPDVITVYAGVNEVVQVPVPYRELYDQWKSGGLHGGAGWLREVRLFQGLRSVVQALRPAVVAVPPEDTSANLSDLIAAARTQHARVLLLSEAVQPRPEAFDPYWTVMRRLAEGRSDVAFYDTADAMRPLGGAAFLDQNHLSPAGHARLAELVAAELRRLGWVGGGGGGG